MSEHRPGLAAIVRFGSRALVVMSAVAPLGCGRELLGGDDDPEAPVAPVTAPLESVDATVHGDPDLDAQGRLLAAEGLVSGFEVPRGMKLVSRQTGFLTFEIGATADALREFYSGVDVSTGRRFAERRYALEEQAVGFDVRHTRDTAERLRLDDRYREGHLYVSPVRMRVQEVRVHLTPPPPSPEDDPFMPKLPPAGPGGEGVPKAGQAGRGSGGLDPSRAGGGLGAANPSDGAARAGGGSADAGGNGGGRGGTPSLPSDSGPSGSGPSGSGPLGAPTPSSAAGGSAGPESAGLPPLVPSNVTGSPTSPSPFGSAAGGLGGRRYGPYPAAGRPIAPAVRQWQSAHPTEPFID